MNKMTFNSNLDTQIEKLETAMLVSIDWTTRTVVFEAVAETFFSELNVEFSRSVNALLTVGEALGIITNEQVSDWKVRRAEYETFVGDKYDEAKAAGKSETEAREFAQAAWEAPHQSGQKENVMYIETQIVARTDERDTVVRRNEDGFGVSIIKGILSESESILRQSFGWVDETHWYPDGNYVCKVARVEETRFWEWAEKALPSHLLRQIRELPRSDGTGG